MKHCHSSNGNICVIRGRLIQIWPATKDAERQFAMNKERNDLFRSSHLAHSHQQGWFNSVNNKASGCMFPCKKNAVLELFLPRPQHQIVTAHRPCWEGELPSGKISFRYYLRSSHMSVVHPSGMRIWTCLALCSLSHYYSFKSRLLWMQTGS